MEDHGYYSWILEERLAAGAAPTHYGVLARLGFTAALSLQESYEDGPEHRKISDGFTQVQVPIRDGVVGGIPSIEQIDKAVEQLHRLLDSYVVYVHCYAGVGRSPLVCSAYLARHHDMDGSAALAFVQRQHKNADPTCGQIAALKSFLDPPASL